MTTSDAPRVLIDKQSRAVYRAQVAVAVAVRDAVEKAGLDRTLVELVNIRISQINGCAYCLDIRVRDALKGGETTQRLAVLSAWRETELFTEQEQAALTLAESVTLLPSTYEQDRDYAEARKYLDDDQLSAVVWVAIAMNSFNRISIVSGHSPRPASKGS